MSEYGQESIWRDTATADAERARDLATRLERRAKAEDEVAARDAYLGLLDIAAGERVLDVGCGSGAVTREIARRVGSRGLAVGLDPSPALLAVARELAHEAGVGDRVEFREGNALRLPFPDRSFDAVVCVTVLSHVPRGEAAIPELVRVLRSGGRLGVFDLDTDMTTFTHPDRTLTRRIVAAASDATAVNGWLARQLPLLFQRAGIVDVRARGFFPLETNLQSFYAGMADRCAEVAAKAGVITEFERRAWLDAFHEQAAQGPIVAGRLHIFVWGRKPE
ncbi:MAG TPA: methyltransferase domain-containing protein [Methylomirabilota bacterium]|nr:methyltransferase domain-containing protein [Methylomirabilota bacterium]